MSDCENKPKISHGHNEICYGQCDKCEHQAHSERLIVENDNNSSLLDNSPQYGNEMFAARNQFYFESKNIVAINLLGVSGAGKTTLLENTIAALSKRNSFYVIETDRQSNYDAERIALTGAQVININTGRECQLISLMINDALKELKPANNSVLFIENLASPLCPTLHYVGEQKKVVVISVTEGEEKPLTYPDMYKAADLCIISKTDLLPFVDVNMEKLKANIRKVNNDLRCITLACRLNDGLDEWYNWLRALTTHKRVN